MISTQKQGGGSGNFGGFRPVSGLGRWHRALSGDWSVLLLITLGWGLLLTITVVIASGQYGLHRDELNFLENGRHLAWGYVEYPPLTPFLARISLELFSLSPLGIRAFTILAVCLVLLLTALMARELGGSRRAQIVAGLVAVTAPLLLFLGVLFSYETFDYLWWVLIAYFMLRLLKSDNPRWWLGIGAAVGLGAMTRYSMVFEVVAIAAGVLFAPARRFLKSPWLWAGVALAGLIVLPNLAWQAQNQWIALRFSLTIHARDISIGNAGVVSYLTGQLYANATIAAIPLWVIGFWYFFRRPEGKRYRALAWMAMIPFVLFLFLQGRYYYLAAIYPMLIAAGCCQIERKWETTTSRSVARWRGWYYGGLATISLLMMVVVSGLPLAPVNSTLWQVGAAANSQIREEIGWTELVETLAGIHNSLPVSEQARSGILAGNMGEAAVVNLYGPAYGLPNAISGMNTYWLRGYGDPPPQTLIVVGFTQAYLSRFFEIFDTCQAAGQVTNRYGIQNVETGAVFNTSPVIYVCRNLRQPWPDFWRTLQYFG